VSAVPDLLAFAPVWLAVRATPPPGDYACGRFVRARRMYVGTNREAIAQRATKQ
jgi:hypothetical protein